VTIALAALLLLSGVRTALAPLSEMARTAATVDPAEVARTATEDTRARGPGITVELRHGPTIGVVGDATHWAERCATCSTTRAPRPAAQATSRSARLQPMARSSCAYTTMGPACDPTSKNESPTAASAS